MGFLDRFTGKEETLEHGWKTLTRMEQLDEIAEASKLKPVMLFKHSTRCGISSRAKFMLESDWDLSPDDLDFYYLDLIALRPISNAIAEKFGVVHQSPQIILIQDGKAVFDTSHHMINAKMVRQSLGL